MITEQRFVAARVRKEHAQGAFERRVLEVTVTVQGSYHTLVEELIAGIREQGYETQHIIDHSVHRHCVS